MKLKKIILGMSAIAALGLLSACSSLGLGSQAPATVSVQSGTYVLESGKTYSDSEGYLALDLSVKNTSGKTISGIYQNAFTLYDGKGNQIKSESVYAGENSKFSTIQSTNLSPDKTLAGYVAFQVDKGSKYELHFNPSPYDKNSKDIVVKVDTSKYSDPAKELEKLAGNYVDGVFFAKKNVSTSLKNDLIKAHSTFEQTFSKNLSSSLSSYYTPSAGETQSVVTAYEAANAKKAQVDYNIAAMFPDYAVVYVKPQVINFSDIDDNKVMNDWENANQGKYDDYSKAEQDAAKYLLQQLPTLINNTATSSPKYMDGNGYKLILTADSSGKWTVKDTDSSDNYDYKDLSKAFMGGMDGY